MVKFFPEFRESQSSEMEQISAQAASGVLASMRKRIQDDGDVRYWNVDASSSPFLTEFVSLAKGETRQYMRAVEPQILLMVNHISYDKTAGGSGGGWHVDSVRSQYKAFCYLTDCQRIEQGPLCLLVHRFRVIEKLIVYMNRLFGGGSRFSERSIAFLERFGFSKLPVLAKKGVPFVVETSRIHRGLPITEGSRCMLTAYIYKGSIPESITSRMAA